MGMIEEVQSSSYHGKGGNANQRDTEICRKHKAQEEIGDGSALHYDLQGQSDTNRRQKPPMVPKMPRILSPTYSRTLLTAVVPK